MIKININKTLLKRLKADYNNAEGQVKFMNGLDYLEAMVKLFGVINISVVKEIDKDIYEKIFFKNFKISPSLGDFKSLSSQAFIETNKNVLLGKDDELYKTLLKLFTDKDLNLQLDMALDIVLDNENTKKKNINTLWNLFEEYVVNFRNKLKGHGASFSSNDKRQTAIILKNLNIIITAIKSKMDELFNDKLSDDEKLLFYILDNNTNNQNQAPLKVIAKYKNKEYQLSPLMIYFECNKFSCKGEHNVKLFFYNDGNASKSYYIDYSLNHYYYFSSNNEVNNMIVNSQKELNTHDTSDNLRHSNLLSSFVGREKELNSVQEHIISNIDANPSTPSVITIKGDPGIGKSAFISKLQEELQEKVEKLQTYIFYARKSDMEDDEFTYFYKEFYSYLYNIDISIPDIDNEEKVSMKKKLEHVFESLNKKLKKPLLLIIDGLDEFEEPVSFLKNFPMKNVPNKIHIVFATRENESILKTLETKLLKEDCNLNILNQSEYCNEHTSITLRELSKYEAEILIGEVLAKEVRRGEDKYMIIQEEIYKKSEGLPLYIHYISNKLKEFNLKSSDIEKDIRTLAKELPKGLKAFYFQTFEELGPISSEILYTLYFSHKNIGFDSFNHLLTDLKNKDSKAFQYRYFNDVEIFLTQDTENKYGFYHLSIKEAIKTYFIEKKNLKAIVEIDYNTFSKDISIAPYQEEQYKKTFNTYYYLKKNSTLFTFLEKIYTDLSNKENDENLSELYQDNYLTYFYKYIHFCNYHEMEVVTKNTLQIDYTKFKTAILSNKIIKLIQKFFKAYESSPKQDIAEIKYAHEFALLVNYYDKILSYAKDYENAFFTLFIDIVWNLNVSKNQKLFKELKYIWSDLYSDEFKYILLHIAIFQDYPEYMFDMVSTIQDKTRQSEILYFHLTKSTNLNFYKRVLSFLDNRNEPYMTELILKTIVRNTKDHELLKMVFSVILETNDERVQTAVLSIIADNHGDTEILERILKIANDMNDDEAKGEVLYHIALLKNDLESWKKLLDSIMQIQYECAKIYYLNRIVEYCKNIKILEEVLEVVTTLIPQSVEDESSQIDILKTIVSNNNNVSRKKIEKVVDKIIGEYSKEEILEYIYSDDKHNKSLYRAENILENQMDDAIIRINNITNQILQSKDSEFLVYHIDLIKDKEDLHERAVILGAIVKKNDDVMLWEKILEASKALTENNRVDILTAIVKKNNGSILLNQVLHYIEDVKEIKNKRKILSTIAIHSNSPELWKNILQLTNGIDKEKEKAKILCDIIFQNNDLELLKKTLEVIDNFKSEKIKIELLNKIIHMNNDSKVLAKTLEVLNSMNDTQDKINCLHTIISSIKTLHLYEKVIDITANVVNESNQASILKAVIRHSSEITLCHSVVQYVHNMRNEWNKSTLLIAILDNCTNSKFQKSVFEITNNIKSERVKVTILKAIIDHDYDKKFYDKILEIAKNMEDPIAKVDILYVYAYKNNDIELQKQVFDILAVLKGIDINTETLLGIVSLTDKENSFDKVINISDRLGDERKQAEILSAIINRSKKIKYFNRSINYVENMHDEWAKTTVLEAIIDCNDDNEFRKRALEIADKFDDMFRESFFPDSARTYDNFTPDLIQADEAIGCDKKSTNKTVQNTIMEKHDNYLSLLHAIFHFNVYESLVNISYTNADVVLEYYGALGNEADINKNFTYVIHELQNLKQERNFADTKGDEALYDQLTQEAKKIKSNILGNKSMLIDMLQQYAVSKLAFKKKDILDII